MTVTATGRTITVPGEFNSTNHDGIQSIVFADGTTLTRDQIQAQAAYRAGTGDVTVTSQDGPATLVAGPGNDVLVAGDQDNTGNTTFVYGSGDGNLEIDAHVHSWNTVANTLQLTDLKPSDVAFTRSGSDLLMTVTATGRTITVPGEFNSTNHDGIQSIVFADGTTLTRDQIQAQAAYRAGTGDVTVTSQDGPATLVAGPGNDVLVAGDQDNTGNTTFVYGSGDGNLEIDAHVHSWNTVANTLQLTDLKPSDVTFTRSGSDLLMTVTATGRTITVPGEFNSTNHDGIQSIVFADGTTLTRDQIQAQAAYRAGTGDVTVTSQDGPATLVAGPGNDVLVAGDQDNTGNTTFVYGSGDGNLEIDAHVHSWNTVANTLQLTDLKPSDVAFTRSGSDLLMTVTATGRTITVPGEFNSTNHDGIQSIVFADGTKWDQASILSNAWLRGADGNDSVTMPDDGATIQLGKGDKSIFLSGNGADVIRFAKGDGHDVIDNPGSGYTRDDTLVLSDTNPNEVVLTQDGDALLITITNTGDTVRSRWQFWANSTQYGINRITFADGTTINREQIQTAIAAGGTVTASSSAQTHSTFASSSITGLTSSASGSTTGSTSSASGSTTGSTSSASGSTTGSASSASGSTTGSASSASGSTTGSTSSASGSITGSTSSSNSTVTGTAGAASNAYDTHDSSNLVYDLGPGTYTVSAFHDDRLTVEWAATDGNQTFTIESSNYSNDAKAVLSGLNAADVILTRGGSNNEDLIVTNRSTGAVLTFTNQFQDSQHGVSAIQFADGTTWDQSAITSHVSLTLTGTANATTLVGGAGDDVLIAGGGNDSLTGGGGSNLFIFGPASGQDTITDFKPSGTGHDLLQFDHTIFADASSALAAASQVGSDVVITESATDKVIMKNTDLSSLTKSDFRIV
ncbi:calcium-binding protein [Methylobacterium sp. C33D]